MESGQLLRAYRLSMGLLQKELAEIIGVRRETLARWESGTRFVDIELLLKVSEVTGIAPAKLRPDLADKLWPEGATLKNDGLKTLAAQA